LVDVQLALPMIHQPMQCRTSMRSTTTMPAHRVGSDLLTMAMRLLSLLVAMKVVTMWYLEQALAEEPPCADQPWWWIGVDGEYDNGSHAI
jgi:hypothetical protein